MTQWRCLSCETPEGFAGGALCRRCEADEAEAWQEWAREADEADAAIETLRVMLLKVAADRAGMSRWLGPVPGDATTVGGRACIAIALALLL